MPKTEKKWLMPLMMWLVFESIAVTLWLTKDNIFYLFNFTYIGSAVALGLLLYAFEIPWARRFVQFAVGLYMLVFLGFVNGENMQIEGFWYYLFSGVFAGATIHYAIAKIFGPVLFGRGWCGYACWTGMVLDLLPYKSPQNPRKPWGWIRFVVLAASFAFALWVFLAARTHAETIMFIAFVAGNIAYYAIGISLAFALKDNRAFCKYLCPVGLLMKPGTKISRSRVTVNPDLCVNCGKCVKSCPMDVDMLDNSRQRANGTECILCLTCVSSCPQKALKL